MYKDIKLNSIFGNYSVKFIDELSIIQDIIDKPNTFTFIDKNVEYLYPSLKRKNNISVECIESNKTIDMANIILNTMLIKGIKSNSKIIVIGGGILQDLIGFCCSIYNRGISYILIPTTLLSQADSCIGGKTSVNFKKKKNILGTFFPPTEILIHTNFLNTLTDLEYLSGMGEVYKFHILQNKMDEFSKSNNRFNIKETVYKSILYKKSIIDKDEFDKNERKFLNFGHTFAHALEYTSNNEIPHGISVIIGSMISCRISSKMGYNVPQLDLIYHYGNLLLKDVNMSKKWFDSRDILNAAMMDKKNNNGNIVDILINNNPLVSIITDDIIDEVLLETYKMIK